MPLLSLIVRGFILDLRMSFVRQSLHVGPHDDIHDPPDAAVSSPAGGHVSSGVLAGSGGAPRAPAPLDMGATGDRLRSSGGPEDVLAIYDAPGADIFENALVRLHRSAEDVFPANRLTMRCAKCGQGIPRFEGYRHIRVGVKKTYCATCQSEMGLPVREGAPRSRGSGEQGVAPTPVEGLSIYKQISVER